MGYRTLDTLDVAGRRVLLRADLNVPVAEGVVGDVTRIERLIPTLRDVTRRRGRLVVLSHFGRPGGRPDAALSLAPVVPVLADALGTAAGAPIAFAHDCIGPAAASCVEAMSDGEIAVLENLRFHPGEEANDPDFVRSLAAHGDIYVGDAFSCAHRAHASTVGLPGVLPSAMGRGMAAEISALEQVLDAPARPSAAVIGGAKISTKLDILGQLVTKVDVLVVAGGMANTFLYAQGLGIGASLCEPSLAESARAILERARTTGCRFVLPLDGVVAPSLSCDAPRRVCAVDEIDTDMMMLDIGPLSVADMNAHLGACKTVLWNGPLGAFEVPPFDRGTVQVAQHVARLTAERKMTSVAGGGDTVGALSHAGVRDQFTYVSTAGGAFLEWVEGKDLPGVAALRDCGGDGRASVSG